MYETLPFLKEPDEQTRLWRYMDFEKFVALLETRTLFFPSLMALSDPFEGHPPKSIIEKAMHLPEISEALSEAKAKELRDYRLRVIEGYKTARRMVCVSCWHMNPVESAAMWDLYCRRHSGIAVVTTFETWKHSFRNTVEFVNGGKVDYVDYDTHVLAAPETNLLQWGVLKRTSFEHEREFRGLATSQVRNADGTRIPIDLDTLISEIYVAPTAPLWFGDLVAALADRYGLGARVKESGLQVGPAYYPE